MTDADTAARAAFARQRAAMAATDTTGPEKAVLLVLAIMANGAGVAWPPVTGEKGLTARSSFGERTVQRALRRLAELGHVTRRHDASGVCYAVHPATRAPRHTDTPPEGRLYPATAAPKQPGTTIPLGDAGASAGIELPAGVLPERWREFVEMRQALAKGRRPKPWTPGAERGVIRTLAAMIADGADPNAALERSTINAWAGLFPPKGDQHGNQRRADRGGQRRADPHPGGRICAAADRVFGGVEDR